MDPLCCIAWSEAARQRGGRPVGEAPFERVWLAGTLAGLGRPTVAIVGTRAPSGRGRAMARAVAADLGRAGCCIVSGLALGIDAAAHEGALDAGAPTIGVLGGGHGRFFPSRNAGLAERIVRAGGAVLSPYAPEHPAQPHQFLARNGIVAALADAVLVVEAPARSGAINTAGWAAGRIPVLAVPGDVDRPHVAGCLALIRDGATLARSAADVLEALGIETQPAVRRAARERDDPLERAILRALRDGERTLDEIVDATTAGAPAVTVCLTILELQGAVDRRDGGVYALRC